MKIIKDEGNYAIVSEIGGTVTSLVLNDVSVIYFQRRRGEKLRGGMPICFPFFGPPKGRFSGIPQHGWLRKEELEGEKSNSSLKFEGTSLGRKDYPWHLYYSNSVSITENNDFLMKFFATRLSDGILGRAPVNPGVHPYFPNLGKRALFIDDKKIINFNEKAEIITAKEKVIIDLGGAKVQLSLGGDFGRNSCFVLWSDSQDYFCVEPVFQDPAYFGDKKGKYLEEGESLTLILNLAVLADR